AHSEADFPPTRASDQGLIVVGLAAPDSLGARRIPSEPARRRARLGRRKGSTMLRTLARNWWAIVLRGIFAVLFGIGTFLWPGMPLAVLLLLLGAFLVVRGIFAVLWALARRNEGSFSWEVFLVGLASLGA